MIHTLIKLCADGAIIPLVLLGGYALLFKISRQDRFESYARIIIAGITAYLFAKFLASVYQPSGERPFEILGVAPGASYLQNAGFPSDHALFSTFLTLAVWFEARQKKIAVGMGLLTLLVCVGRVLALVHTPLDVVGGVLVAFMGALWYMQPKIKNGVTTTRKKHKEKV